ncbi:MAG: sulfotransferase domain-containing protein [Candidatus Aminicenantales bacterium]
MELDENANYIVSGIERSGTSLLMQMLDAGGVPTSFDPSSRPADENNPRGYYELEGGKIINRLMEGNFPFEKYRGKFIKITAYGLKFLPPGKYRIIYTERNIEEILDSMEKMAKTKDENREDTRRVFLKLNRMIKHIIIERDDIEVLFVNYNHILGHPEENIEKICDFLGSPGFDLDKMVRAVDKKLYRNRRAEIGGINGQGPS